MMPDQLVYFSAIKYVFIFLISTVYLGFYRFVLLPPYCFSARPYRRGRRLTDIDPMLKPWAGYLLDIGLDSL